MTMERIDVLAEQLCAISKEDLSLYLSHQEILLKRMKQELLEYFDSCAFTGINRQEIVFEFQKNHIKYIISTLSLNNLKLTLKLIIWMNRVYLHKGISEPDILWIYSKWQEIVSDFLPENNSASILLFYRFIIENHHEFMEIARSEVSLDIPFIQPLTEPQQSLLQLLLKGDIANTKLLADNLVKSREDYVHFCIHVIQPVMYQIGLLWEIGKINVAHEHMATAIIARILAQLYYPFVFGDCAKGKVVISTVCNEKHEIGARIVADFLEIDGWEVHFLGGDVPETDHLDIIMEKEPDLVGLSVTMPYNIGFANKLINDIQQKSQKSCGILLGGPLFHYVKDSFAQVNTYYCQNASEALKYANQFIAERM